MMTTGSIVLGNDTEKDAVVEHLVDRPLDPPTAGSRGHSFVSEMCVRFSSMTEY